MHAKLWTDTFLPGLPVIDKILCAVIVYFFLVIALKLAGRRELAQLNAFDLVVLLTVANTVQDAIIGNDNSVTGGLIGASMLLLVNYLVTCFLYEYSHRHQKIGASGKVLIRNGRVLQGALKKELITMDELREAANRQGVESLREIEQPILNSDGPFAFVKKEEDQAGGNEHQEILNRIDDLSELVARLGLPGG